MTTNSALLKSSPLTTTFTPPPTCTDSFANDGVVASPTGTLHPLLQATFPQSSACFAPGWTSAPNVYGKGANYWSGDPVCPSGQSVAQTYSINTWTTAICCSSGWGDVFTNGNDYDSTIYPFYMCQSSWSTPATTTVFGTVESGGIISGATATLTGPGGFESTAEYIFMYSTLSPTTTQSSSSTPEATASGPTNSASITPLSQPASPGLSGGAIAGICIGIILLMAGLGVLWWSRRRMKAAANREGDGYIRPGGDKAELAGEDRIVAELSHGQPRQVAELPGTGWQESKPANLYMEPVELESR